MKKLALLFSICAIVCVDAKEPAARLAVVVRPDLLAHRIIVEAAVTIEWFGSSPLVLDYWRESNAISTVIRVSSIEGVKLEEDVMTGPRIPIETVEVVPNEPRTFSAFRKRFSDVEPGRYVVSGSVAGRTKAGAGVSIILTPFEFVVERQKGPNQTPQRNAGSRPSSGDLSASETPSSLGPRG